ncbi:HD domain-containing protein [Nesterenkonia alkaliphila]|uniref:HD domain-containing protein n=1 Tax=Nesterenkonia alkaliphila TaxID=1463631 RepID=A0A7K1UGM9_9MICC|nr:HD domain-containing protein [Nesterenkonia alkaliphila]MVT25625.1 HD domain-containing protein [Nesterenkonia alkaliphila]
MTEDYVRTAEEIARRAHTGQTDKLGIDYIEHPARVAERVRKYNDSAEAVAAAWLHDVLEDTPVTAENLRAARLPEEVITVVELLTKRPGQRLADYCNGVRQNPIALAVKHADIDDNTDPTRTSQLPQEIQDRLRKKYERTRHFLQNSPHWKGRAHPGTSHAARSNGYVFGGTAIAPMPSAAETAQAKQSLRFTAEKFSTPSLSEYNSILEACDFDITTVTLRLTSWDEAADWYLTSNNFERLGFIETALHSEALATHLPELVVRL